MPSKVIIAAAGSGKTHQIIEEVMSSNEKTLVLTYTNENLQEIKNRFCSRNGIIPSHVKVQSWFSFLISEGVRPYQNFIHLGERAKSLNFQEVPPSHRYVPRSQIDRYYFSSSGNIYRDKVADFAVRCNEVSKGLVVQRISEMYSRIYIDEIQDLAGYDLDFLELLFVSGINITVVGDTRQATYSTNYSQKNSKYRGGGIINWFLLKEKEGKCTIEYRVECYRCIQSICDFADGLFPHLPKTKSLNIDSTGHDGLFIVHPDDIAIYIDKFHPKILKQDKNVTTLSGEGINFGLSKGQTYERVLIYPTKQMLKFLQSKQLTKIMNGKEVVLFDITKFYVALTRAKFSVAFVTENQSAFEELQYFSPCSV